MQKAPAHQMFGDFLEGGHAHLCGLPPVTSLIIPRTRRGLTKDHPHYNNGFPLHSASLFSTVSVEESHPELTDLVQLPFTKRNSSSAWASVNAASVSRKPQIDPTFHISWKFSLT